MKHFAKYSIALLSVLLLSFSCAKSGEEQPKAEAPVVSYEIEDDTINIMVGESVSFAATVDSPVEYSCGWYLDGKKISRISKVTHTFEQIGTFKVSFKVENEAGSAEKVYTVNVAGEPLEVTYSVTEELIKVNVTETVAVSVTVTGGDKGTKHSWTLDGEIVSETASFEKNIAVPGTYSLVYHGVNDDHMTASKSWTIEVSDLPLSVDFSVEEGDVTVYVGRDYTFTATPKAGLNGFAQKWAVDGVQKSEGNSLTVNFDAEGTHTVSYVATNSSEDKIEASWTVKVEQYVASTILFADFENDAEGSSSFFIGNTANNVHVMQVVPNPHKTSVNSSDKVLADLGSLITWSSSAYFKFKVNTYPDGRELSYDTRSQYTKIKVMVYLGESDFTPLLQEDAKSTKSVPSVINGIAFDTVNPTMDAWRAAVKTNDWNVFIYDLTSAKYSSDVNSLSNTDQLQFRVCVDFKNNGKMPGDVYFDNIEFLE